MRNDILEQAQEIRTSIDSVTGTMADADAAKNPMLFLPWETDTKYAVGDRRRHDGKVYKCLQAHTSQAGWEPPALVVEPLAEEAFIQNHTLLHWLLYRLSTKHTGVPFFVALNP
jgi:hypothetical protein